MLSAGARTTVEAWGDYSTQARGKDVCGDCGTVEEDNISPPIEKWITTTGIVHVTTTRSSGTEHDAVIYHNWKGCDC